MLGASRPLAPVLAFKFYVRASSSSREHLRLRLFLAPPTHQPHSCSFLCSLDQQHHTSSESVSQGLLHHYIPSVPHQATAKMSAPGHMLAPYSTRLGQEQWLTHNKDHIAAQIESYKLGWKRLIEKYREMPLSTRLDLRLDSAVDRVRCVAILEHLAPLPADADFTKASTDALAATHSTIDSTLPANLQVPYTRSWYEDLFEAEECYKVWLQSGLTSSGTGEIYHYLFLAQENFNAAEALLSSVLDSSSVQPPDRPLSSIIKGWNEMCRLIRSGSRLDKAVTDRAAMVTELDICLGGAIGGQRHRHWFEATVLPPPIDWSRKPSTPAIPVPIGNPEEAKEILDPGYQSSWNANQLKLYISAWEELPPYSANIRYPSSYGNKTSMLITLDPAFAGRFRYRDALTDDQKAKLTAAKFFASGFNLPVFRTEAGELRLSRTWKSEKVQKLAQQLEVESLRWSEGEIGRHHGRAGDAAPDSAIAKEPVNIGVRTAIEGLKKACESHKSWVGTHGEHED